MKEMKMSDVFNLPLNPVTDLYGSVNILDELSECVSDGYYDDFEIAATHAINNHDRLQQENAELREFVCSLQLDVSNEIKLEELLAKLNQEGEE